MDTRIRFVAALLAALLAPAAAQANLLTNGDFTSPPPGSPPFITVFSPSTDIPGWTVSSGSVDFIFNYWQGPPSASHSIDLDGLSPGAISQTFATNPGQSYTVTFWLSGNPDGPPTTKELTVSAGASSEDFTFTLSPSQTKANMGWIPETFSFTAIGTTTTLEFASDDGPIPGWPNGSPFGPAIGEISVLVPEPSSITLFGIGLLSLAAFLRRQKRK